MTLPFSGAMSTAAINTELNRSTSAPFDLTDSEVLALAGKTAGQSIQLPQDLYGKGYARGWVDTTRNITIGYDADSTTSYGGSPIAGYGYISSPACGSISSSTFTDTNGNSITATIVGSRYNWLSGGAELVTISAGTWLPDKVGVTFTVGGGAFYCVGDRRLSMFGYQYMVMDVTTQTNLKDWLYSKNGQSGIVRLRDPV